MIQEKIDRLKKESDHAEYMLLHNMSKIEGKDVLKGIVGSIGPSSISSISDSLTIPKLDMVMPIVRNNKTLLFIYNKMMLIKKLYDSLT